MRLFISIYFDENVTLELARILTRRGFDVLTARDAGMLGRSDADQLEFSISQERAIVTHNRDDFLDLNSHYLADNKLHFGIIILVRREPTSEMIRRLLGLLDQVTADEMANQLRFV